MIFFYHNNNRQHARGNKGYILLISVLILGAIGIAVASSLLLLGLGSSRSSFAFEQSNQAKLLANACAEEGLQQIRNVTSFTGVGNFSLGQGSCAYLVTSQGGENRIVEASSTVDTIVRKTKVTVNDINPAIVVVSWVDVVN